MKTNRPHLPRLSCILLLPCLILALPPAIRATELTVSDGANPYYFGNSVSLSGNAGLAGAYVKDAAYVFLNLDTASGTVTENAKLTVSDGTADDDFGNFVSLSGNAGLAGAYVQDNGKGAAYVFRNLDTASGTVTENAKLTTFDRVNWDFFGYAVSLSGNAGLVGAYGKDNYKGAAYVFRNLDTASGTVTENAKLTASDGTNHDYFGSAISLSGNTGLVGAPGKDTANGAAYVFRNLDTASGTVTQNAKLTASDGMNEGAFGGSVSLSGNAGLAGAYVQDNGKGAAYVFRNLDTASGTVTENAKLTVSDRAAGDYFGISVSLSGNAGLVGAQGKNGEKGAAYLFRNLDTASGTITENVKLTASRGVASVFGKSLTLDGDRFVIGGNGIALSGSSARTRTATGSPSPPEIPAP